MIERRLGWLRAGFILLLVVGLSVFQMQTASATHLRAGQITVERQNCLGRQFLITVTVYTDTGSPVRFGGEQDILDFGDGNRVLVPETPNTPYPGAPNVGYASYSILWTYAGPGRYTISYLEPNRNEGVLNIENSVLTTFYIETQIDITVLGCDDSPQLLVPPIDLACTGVAFFHNPGAYDENGDSLSYELVTPFRDRNLPVVNYRDPNNQSFYSMLDYEHANEAGDGRPTFTIDPVDGTIRWDAPGAIGEYNIAFIIREWRKINGVWTDIGFVRRDMQIIVADDCTNDRPELVLPEDTCVVAGTTLHEIILGTDPNNNNVKIEAFSEIFDASFPSPATVSPPVSQPSVPAAELEFEWNTTCEHVKDQAYLVVFKITDFPGTGGTPQTGPPLVTFDTWRITVVGPAPVLQDPPTIDLAKRHVTLEWDPYDCFKEASTMQIWRRVDETSFTPDECQTGMPKSLGFTLIGQVPIKNGQGSSATPVTTYKDTNEGKGLSVGARYCYRLVALFPLPLGGESYVSNEVCIDPIDVDAPVITEVSVIKTGDTDGEIKISWTPPFQINDTQFPGPYEYLVQRAVGTGFENVSPESPRITTTTYTESGLDTRDDQFFYRIVLYSPTQLDPTVQPIDTSSLASSVWLDLNAQKSQIELVWSAVVPWSNQLEDYPMHRIYRGAEGATENELVLIDSVNVTQDGFVYLDTGKLAPGDSLNGALTYCYRVMTRGGYGNPAIAEPLKNFSQINCAQPTDDIPPCKPDIAAFVNTCENFFTFYSCDATSFSNTVSWNAASGPCGDDVRYYNVYAATVENGTYDLIATNVRDTFYLHENLATLAYCYRIAAVDRSNNLSELSDPVCNNNCPYYELPNVFTPNSDGCNDLFSAFGVQLNLGEDTSCPEVEENAEKCARFIQRVDFTVYNRWGNKVYHYVGQQGDENTIYINWDGRDDRGRDLAAAVYFYVAEVTRDVVDPNDRTKIIKGWVHLAR